MNYNTLFDDNFSRADTLPGNGANSTTGVGNGWVDLIGNIYGVQAAAGGVTRLLPTGVLGAKCPLYQPASAALVNGKVRFYVNLASTRNRSAVFRASTYAGYGSGYFAGMTSNNEIVIGKLINDQQTILLDEVPYGITPPSSFVLEASCQQLEPRVTQLSVSIFDPANLAVALTTRSYKDNEPGLQNLAGIMGVSSTTHGFDVARVVLYALVS